MSNSTPEEMRTVQIEKSVICIHDYLSHRRTSLGSSLPEDITRLIKTLPDSPPPDKQGIPVQDASQAIANSHTSGKETKARDDSPNGNLDWEKAWRWMMQLLHVISVGMTIYEVTSRVFDLVVCVRYFYTINAEQTIRQETLNDPTVVQDWAKELKRLFPSVLHTLEGVFEVALSGLIYCMLGDGMRTLGSAITMFAPFKSFMWLANIGANGTSITKQAVTAATQLPWKSAAFLFGYVFLAIVAGFLAYFGCNVLLKFVTILWHYAMHIICNIPFYLMYTHTAVWALYVVIEHGALFALLLANHQALKEKDRQIEYYDEQEKSITDYQAQAWKQLKVLVAMLVTDCQYVDPEGNVVKAVFNLTKNKTVEAYFFGLVVNVTWHVITMKTTRSEQIKTMRTTLEVREWPEFEACKQRALSLANLKSKRLSGADWHDAFVHLLPDMEMTKEQFVEMCNTQEFKSLTWKNRHFREYSPCWADDPTSRFTLQTMQVKNLPLYGVEVVNPNTSNGRHLVDLFNDLEVQWTLQYPSWSDSRVVFAIVDLFETKLGKNSPPDSPLAQRVDEIVDLLEHSEQPAQTPPSTSLDETKPNIKDTSFTTTDIMLLCIVCSWVLLIGLVCTIVYFGMFVDPIPVNYSPIVGNETLVPHYNETLCQTTHINNSHMSTSYRCETIKNRYCPSKIAHRPTKQAPQNTTHQAVDVYTLLAEGDMCLGVANQQKQQWSVCMARKSWTRLKQWAQNRKRPIVELTNKLKAKAIELLNNQLTSVIDKSSQFFHDVKGVADNFATDTVKLLFSKTSTKTYNVDRVPFKQLPGPFQAVILLFVCTVLFTFGYMRAVE